VGRTGDAAPVRPPAGPDRAEPAAFLQVQREQQVARRLLAPEQHLAGQPGAERAHREDRRVEQRLPAAPGLGEEEARAGRGGAQGRGDRERRDPDAEQLPAAVEVAEPSPGDDEVAIDVAYSGINFADVQMRIGLYPDAPELPFIPGYEVSGTVRAVGGQVTGFAPGDRVVAGCYFGGYASAICVPARQVFKLPASLDLATGAFECQLMVPIASL